MISAQLEGSCTFSYSSLGRAYHARHPLIPPTYKSTPPSLNSSILPFTLITLITSLYYHSNPSIPYSILHIHPSKQVHLLASASMSEHLRKDLHTKAYASSSSCTFHRTDGLYSKETVVPETTKSSGQRVKEDVTGSVDRVARYYLSLE